MILAARPILRRWLFGLGAVVVVLTASTLILLMAATGPLGRWAVMQLADGRELARGLVVEIDGLSGNVLQNPVVQTLTLRNADGVFLTVENLSLNWNSLVLLGREVDIEEIGASHIELLRSPVLAPASGNGSRLPPIRIGSVAITDFALNEAVLGEAATFTVRGQARMRGEGRLEARIVRTDIEGDRVEGELAWSQHGQLSGSIDAFIAGAGPLGTLLRLDGRDAQLIGEMSGTPQSGTGAAQLAVAGREAASADFDWQDGRWSARIDADGNVLASDRSLPIGLEARVQASGTIIPFRPDTAEAAGNGWRIMANPLGDQRLQAEISLSPPALSALTGENIALEVVRWSGTIDYASGITADGVVEIQSLAAMGVSVEAAGGALLFTRQEERNSVFVDLTASSIALPGTSPIANLPWLGLAFEAHQRNGVYEIGALEIDSDAFAVSGELNIDPDGWIATADAELSWHESGLLTDQVSGPINAEMRIAEVSRERLRMDVTINGSELVWQQPTLENLFRETRISGALETDFADWQISGIRLNSRGALLRGNANGTGSNWSTSLVAAVNGDITLANATLGGGAAIAIEASGEGTAVTGNAVISTPRFAVSGREFQQPQLGLEFNATPEQQFANWQLESQTDYGALLATGEFERSRDSIRVTVDQGHLDGYAFAGTASTNGQGFTARLTGQNWQLAQGEIDVIELTATRDDADTRFTAVSSGTFRDSYSLSATATLSDERLSARLTGEWAGIPIETVDPLIYRFADEIPEFHGRLTTGGGNVRLRWTAENRLRITMTDLPADILATAGALPAMDGDIGFDLFLRHNDGFWSGDITADARQLRVRQLRTGGAIDLDLSGQLGDGLTLVFDVRGDDLSGTGQLRRTGRISGLEELRQDAPLNGQISLAGAVEPLLALVLSDTRQLAGDISANLMLSGTVFQSRLSGTTEFANGRYVSEELGISVSDVSAAGIWENDQFSLQRFTALDGRNGTLAITGSGGFTDGGWQADANIEFTNFNAVRRPDLNVIATGNADVDLSNEGIQIGGEATLNRIDARPPEASAASFAEIDVTEINRADGENGQRRRRIPIVLDYRIRANDSIFVSAETFSTEWRGDWHVTGDPSSPDIQGDAILVYGRAFLLNRAFRMEEGRVALAGGAGTAEIDLLARHQRDSLTVDARVSGPVSSPELTLSSQPALPQDEILARLLFDRNSGQLSPLETATIAAQLSGQNLFGIVGGLRRAAGLDRLDFSAGENGQIVVTGGRQLTDDVYLELESRGAALSSARLEWTLTPDFSLLSRLTGDTQASIALRWRTEY